MRFVECRTRNLRSNVASNVSFFSGGIIAAYPGTYIFSVMLYQIGSRFRDKRNSSGLGLEATARSPNVVSPKVIDLLAFVVNCR